MPDAALDLAALDALAQKATPGPWTRNQRGEIRWPGSKIQPCGIISVVTDPTHPTAIADAAYIAAVSPEVVRGMIARIHALEEALREADTALDLCGPLLRRLDGPEAFAAMRAENNATARAHAVLAGKEVSG